MPKQLSLLSAPKVDGAVIETILVEVANPGHPIGIRGVGEVPIVPPPAAIANAIYRATGVRMTELPMSPAKVAKAILEKRGEEDDLPRPRTR